MLKDLIEQKYQTVEEFAEVLREKWGRATGRGCAVSTVYSWLSGEKQPELKFLETLILLEVLDCTLIELNEAFQNIRKPDVKARN